MIEPKDFAAILNAIQVTVTFLQAAIHKIKDAAVREKVQELLTAIIPLQTEILALQKENSLYIGQIKELKEELREIKKWSKQESAYEPKELAPSVCVYVKKPEGNAPRPTMYYCANCFDAFHRISPLTRRVSDIISYVCPNCPAKISLDR